MRYCKTAGDGMGWRWIGKKEEKQRKREARVGDVGRLKEADGEGRQQGKKAELNQGSKRTRTIAHRKA